VKYNVFLTSTFLRNYKKLPEGIQRRVKEEIALLGNNPFAGKKLTGHLHGDFSCRAGDYRIIYCISKDGVFIEAVGHRKDIYRKRK